MFVSSTQLWRYAISGCDQNRELKVWSCTNWSCLQIIRYLKIHLLLIYLFFSSFQYSFIDSAFHPPTQLPILKASIDLTSRFLVLSDVNRNVKDKIKIYFLHKTLAFI
jgi:enhancer of mRNA-decapping protein 4